ncbi:MAG: transporter [Crocinitomicaceae bacterium]|nr:transporter [Crocinitomicaceae bacterium]|tara:strand:- start:5215 stop:5631 length:417 start_codon:yes stop_codon:yes gene_type:complete
MFNTFKYILVGFIFGITMYQSEAVSWFRIFEMFHFQSFHMYGIIGTAVVLGIIIVQGFKRGVLKDFHHHDVTFQDKNKSIPRYLIGGIIFGLGWALGGACPGPMFVLIGAGYPVFILFLFAAMAGTFAYGMIRSKLPH